MVSSWPVSDLYVHPNAPNNPDANLVSHLLVSSSIFLDQYGNVWNDGGISFHIFQGAVVRRRPAVRQYGLDLQRLCDCRRDFDTPPDLDGVDDGSHETGIPDDGVVLAQANPHFGSAVLLCGNGNIAGPHAKSL